MNEDRWKDIATDEELDAFFGCGCCAEGGIGLSDFIDRAVAQIVKELEAEKPKYDLFLPTGIAASYAYDDAIKIVKGEK